MITQANKPSGSGGGGGGTVTGTGTANKIAKWSAASVLTNSSTTDDGAIVSTVLTNTSWIQNDTAQTIIASFGTIKGLSLNGSTQSFGIGDTGNNNNNTKIIVDDSLQTIDIRDVGLITIGNQGSGHDVHLKINDATSFMDIVTPDLKINGVSGFSGSGAYTNFDIVNGLITNAS